MSSFLYQRLAIVLLEKHCFLKTMVPSESFRFGLFLFVLIGKSNFIILNVQKTLNKFILSPLSALENIYNRTMVSHYSTSGLINYLSRPLTSSQAKFLTWPLLHCKLLSTAERLILICPDHPVLPVGKTLNAV